MKKLILIALTLIPVHAYAADTKCAENRSIAIVDGMVCDFCAQGLIKTFKKNEAVSDVKIDLTSKEVTIDLKPGASIDDTEIAKKVDWSGYKLVKIDHVCKKG